MNTQLSASTFLVPLTVIAAGFLAMVVSLGASATEQRCSDCAPCFETLAEQFRNRGWLGLGLHFDDRRKGLEVMAIDPAGPAASSSLRQGDLIVEISGRATRDATTLAGGEGLLADIRPRQRVELVVARGDERVRLTVVALPMPPDALARAIGYHVLQSRAEDPGVQIHGHPPSTKKPPGG